MYYWCYVNDYLKFFKLIIFVKYVVNISIKNMLGEKNNV